MGAGSYTSAAASFRATTRVDSGTDFYAYSKTARAIHEALDPANKPIRECRDNADNPEAVPIALMIDVTGSNTRAANPMINSFHKCMDVILDAGVKYPSVLIGAVGDNTCDNGALQVGEFESDDELMEASASKIWLEGGGGGQNKESYALPLAFAFGNIQTDHWEKRGKKGHLFIVADEASHDLSTADCSRFKINGQAMTVKEAYELAATRWHIWILRPAESHYAKNTSIIKFWEDVVGSDRIIQLEKWDQLNGTIASLTAMEEGVDATAISDAVSKHGVTVSSSVSIVPRDTSTSLEIAPEGDVLARA
jgi:hypothetical protein